MPLLSSNLSQIDLPPVPEVKIPSYNQVSKIAPLISFSDYMQIQATAFSEHTPSQVVFVPKNSADSYSVTITPEGIVYIHLGRRGRLVGEGSFKKVYECIRLQGNSVKKMAEARIKDSAKLNNAFGEDDLAKKLSSAYNIEGSETAFTYIGKNGNFKGRFLTPLKAMDGLQFLERNPSVEHRLVVLEEISKGLKSLHDAGYLHRDVKPENILIDDAGHAKLADVGLAAHHTKIIETAGTSCFLPVGTFLSDGTIVLTERQTFKTDLYALGLTMFEIMQSCIHSTPKGVDQLIMDLTEEHPLARPPHRRGNKQNKIYQSFILI